MGEISKRRKYRKNRSKETLQMVSDGNAVALGKYVYLWISLFILIEVIETGYPNMSFITSLGILILSS
jgi:hypothetical protein